MNIMGMGRITIGLYNSYDSTKFREPHRRAIARAGGLAMSFNMNLALIGFPFPEDLSTPLELAKWVAGTTSIGSHGDYFVDLAEKGRFHSFPYPFAQCIARMDVYPALRLYADFKIRI